MLIFLLKTINNHYYYNSARCPPVQLINYNCNLIFCHIKLCPLPRQAERSAA